MVKHIFGLQFDEAKKTLGYAAALIVPSITQQMTITTPGAALARSIARYHVEEIHVGHFQPDTMISGPHLSQASSVLPHISLSWSTLKSVERCNLSLNKQRKTGREFQGEP